MIASWQEKYDKSRQCVKKQRHYSSDKVCIVKDMLFPVLTYGCESWRVRRQNAKNWCLWTVVLERLRKVLWTARRSNQSILKEINSEYSLEGLMLKLKLQYLNHLMWKMTHWKSPWCRERMRAEGEDGIRGWNGWMELRMQWTRTWANLEKWWRAGRPATLHHFVRGIWQRVRHHWVTEQQQLPLKSF